MKLTPVDFKAVAAKGCFVYCYLRCKGGEHGKLFSPYYVGLSTAKTSYHRGLRPFGRHPGHKIPKDRKMIRVLKSALTVEQAQAWEKFYIFWFGRVIEGGMLHNKAEGGETNAGFKHTDEFKKRHAIICAQYGNELEQMSECAEALEAAGRCTFDQYTKMSYKDRQAFRKYLQRNPDGTYEIWANQSHSDYAKQGAIGRLAAAAARVGASVEQWSELTKSHRIAVRAWLKRNPDKTFADWFMPRYRAA